MSSVPVISLVIPLFGEGSHFYASYKEILQSLDRLQKSYEVLLIDDGSSDDTWEVIQELARTVPLTRGFRLSRNFGKEPAMAAGLVHARGRAVIVMDGDLQHPPELIPEMVRLWEEGAHVVDVTKAKRGDDTCWYRLCVKTFCFLMSRLSGFDFEGTSDFKLLDRRVVNAWMKFGETQIFYRGLIEWMGFRHVRLPMVVRNRKQGASSWSFFSLIRLALTGLTSFSTIALHGVTLLGALFLLFAAFFSLYTLHSWMAGKSLEGFATVILLQMFIGGAIMVSLGIIGEYLASIFWETKRRPRYVVMETTETEGDTEFQCASKRIEKKEA